MTKGDYSIECEKCNSYNISPVKCITCWKKQILELIEKCLTCQNKEWVLKEELIKEVKEME